MNRILLVVSGLFCGYGADYISLQIAYGPAPEVNELVGWADRSAAAGSAEITRDPDYVTSREECSFALDVVVIMDMTSVEAIGNVQESIGTVYDRVQAKFPGSKMGVASFIDKPILPFGNPLDSYCYKLELALTSDRDQVVTTFTDLVDSGLNILEGDLYNSQFDAIVDVISDDRMGWSTPAQSTTRLIILATNTPPHFAKDDQNTPDLPPWSSPDNLCTNQYYPAPTDILAAITTSETYLMTAAMPGDSQMLSYINFEWLAAYLSFTSDLADVIDSTNTLPDAVAAVLDRIAGAECNGDNTTAPAEAEDAESVTTPAAATASPVVGATTVDATMTLVTGTGIVGATTAPTTATDAAPTMPATTAAASPTTTPAAATTTAEPTTVNTSAQSTTMKTSFTSAASGGSGQSTNAGSTGGSECKDGCPCPEVMIQLMKLPKAMEFQMNGTGGK